ncbi:hypothetical protein ACJX0J_022979 [Zea mays]
MEQSDSKNYLTISFVSLHWARVGGYWWLGRGALYMFKLIIFLAGGIISRTNLGEVKNALWPEQEEKQEVVWDFYNNLLGTAQEETAQHILIHEDSTWDLFFLLI